jgi:hypothetical protein
MVGWMIPEFTLILVWALLYFIKKDCSTYSSLTFLISWNGLAYLRLNGNVSDALYADMELAVMHSNFKFALYIFTVINYNSFLVSLISLPTFFLIPYYFILRKKTEQIDPTSSQKTQQELDDDFFHSFGDMFVLVLMCLVHHYLV